MAAAEERINVTKWACSLDGMGAEESLLYKCCVRAGDGAVGSESPRKECASLRATGQAGAGGPGAHGPVIYNLKLREAPAAERMEGLYRGEMLSRGAKALLTSFLWKRGF